MKNKINEKNKENFDHPRIQDLSKNVQKIRFWNIPCETDMYFVQIDFEWIHLTMVIILFI